MAATLEVIRHDSLGQSQKIESRIIRPTTAFGAANGSVRFKLPQTGIMDDDAAIQFKLLAADANQFLPGNAGIYGLIERAVLFCGNKQIMSTQNANHLMTLQRGFRNPETRMGFDTVKMGAWNASLMVGNENVGAVLEQGKGMNKLDMMNPAVVYNDARTVATVAAPYNITNNAATSPTFFIELKDLFPSFMARMELPLGLSRDPFSIELTFSEDVPGSRTCYTQGNTHTVGNVVDTDSLVLMCDLLYYANAADEVNVMENLANTMNTTGINYEYVDVISQASVYPQIDAVPGAGASAVQSVARLAGMAGETVRNLLFALPNQPFGAAGSGSDAGNAILGRYFSEASQGETTLRCNVNSVPIYPRAVGLGGDAELWNQLCQCYGINYNVGQGEYSSEGSLANNAWAVATQQGMSTATLNGWQQQLLRGMQQYLGIPLQKGHRNVPGEGTKVSTQPVEVVLDKTRTAEVFRAANYYTFGHIERSFSLRGGIVAMSGM